MAAGGLLATHAVAEDTIEAEPAPPGRIEFVGRNLFATANGTFHAWRIVDQRLDLDALAQSEVVVEVDLSSVDTGNGRRDEHLRTADFFEVETYPTARVRAHSPRPDRETEAGRPRYAVRYEIDLHGVTRTLEGEAWIESESPLVFEGRVVIDRMAFGIGEAPSRWNPMSIEAEIPIRFRVELEETLR
jgi:polyisoprenoid-binding protein YceI